MVKHRILVTGGAGFIGSHLCEHLLKMGEEVLCLDNYYTGRRENIQHLTSNPNSEMIRHDMVEPVFLEVDQIYNLACPASPVHYQHNPIKTIKTNVIGTMNALGIAKRVGARLLQASTSEVYGDPQVHPQTEDYWGNVNCTGIRSCYDEGKRTAETLCFDYHRQHQVDIRVARIFNTYGPQMNPNDGRVVSNFIVQTLAGKPITIYGEGNQTRSFCYVEDLVNGLVRLMNTNDIIGPVNLGNPREITILELAEMVRSLRNNAPELRHLPLPQDDPKMRQPDITKAKKYLDWNPRVPLEHGLKSTFNYFHQLLS